MRYGYDQGDDMMRKLSSVITAFFIVLAALLGWFLPIVDFDAYDKFSEGIQKDLEIKQINLSYRDDLAMSQKINISNYEYEITGGVELDKGIYVQKDELAKIVGDFLADFSGYRFNVSQNWYAAPMLVNLSNNRGTIVIWAVDVWLDDNWEFNCLVDDKTGAILRLAFFGDPAYWDDLVHGFDDSYDGYQFLSDRFRTAIYNHYASRLNAKIVSYHLMDNMVYDDSYTYLYIFKDDRNYTFQLSVNFSIPYGQIDSN